MVESGHPLLYVASMNQWTSGYTKGELDGAQDRYRVRFPPDLIDLFLDRQPAQGYAWNIEDRGIRDMLDWPMKTLLLDVEHGFWWPDWGDRPSSADERREVLQGALAIKPRLIPLLGHRFLPETPSDAGNPVFSTYGFDTIYYGSNLTEYFANEFGGQRLLGAVRHIPFWSDITEQHEVAYACYLASDEYQSTKARMQSKLQPDVG